METSGAGAAWISAPSTPHWVGVGNNTRGVYPPCSPGAVPIHTLLCFVRAPNVWQAVLREQMLFRKLASSQGLCIQANDGLSVCETSLLGIRVYFLPSPVGLPVL